MIHAKVPHIRIIGLSAFEDPERAAAIRQAGTVNYITKGSRTRDLISDICASMVLPKAESVTKTL